MHDFLVMKGASCRQHYICQQRVQVDLMIQYQLGKDVTSIGWISIIRNVVKVEIFSGIQALGGFVVNPISHVFKVSSVN